MDPNNFVNWGGDGTAYQSGPLAASIPGIGDVADIYSDGILAQYATIGSGYDIVTTILSDGMKKIVASGIGAFINESFAIVGLMPNTMATVSGDGNSIVVLSDSTLTYYGYDNEIDAANTVVINGHGGSNILNFWGLNETININYFQIPYNPHDSIYDSADDILNGYYALIYGNTKNPRSPEAPNPTSIVIEEPDEESAAQSSNTLSFGQDGDHSVALNAGVQYDSVALINEMILLVGIQKLDFELSFTL